MAASTRSEGHPGWGRPLPVLALLSLSAALVLRLALIPRHAFNPDEFQHLHGAWCIADGLLPYRDYFEHHTPWLHFFLAAFLRSSDVAGDAAAAERFVFAARGLMWAFSALALALTVWLGRLWRGEAVGWVAVALLCTSVVFLDKTLEIRPDVPAAVFLLGSWVALLRGLGGGPAAPARIRPFAEAGFLLGTALLCTQKVLFAGPGLGVWLITYVASSSGPPRRRRWSQAAGLALGVAAPLALVAAAFAANGALVAFLRDNFLVNLRWPVRFSPGPLLRQVVHDNLLLTALGLAGLGAGLLRLRREGAAAGTGLLAFEAAGLLFGLFLMPVPYAQYLVLLLPLWALLAGSALVDVASRLVAAPGTARRIGLAALVLVVGAGSLRPLSGMAGMLHPGHTRVADQLERLRYLSQNAGPRDVVMDGFSGLGVFRPHAFFHFFLHDEVRVLLEGREMARLSSRLRDGLIAPDWLGLDEHLDRLPPDVVAFFHQNYEPTGVGPLWRRKRWNLQGGWLDLGGGPTDALAGQGWYAPRSQEGRTFRGGRGRRSTIRLPVARPEACAGLLVRARQEYPAAQARVHVAVNGVDIGAFRLGPGWRDYELLVPRGALRAGVNALALTWDPEPHEVEASFAGRNTLAAVDGLRLDCGGDP